MSASLPGVPQLEVMSFNNPEATVPVGVGLTCCPVVWDFDGDGVDDILLSCECRRWNNTHYFRNLGKKGEAKPVFECIEKYCGWEVLDSIPVYVAPREVVTDMTGHHLVRGLWMAVRRKPGVSAEEFLKNKKRIAVMVDVVNPVNVGAIFRSAAALGMDGVLLTHKSVDPLTRRTARVSMGTVFQIPWAQASLNESEGDRLLDLLRTNGFKTVAMALTDDSTNVDNDEIRSNEKVAILLGTEGTGLPKDMISACDYRVMIPMHYGVDSLNVAVASAISFWELMK